ncbi:fimbrial protein [Burkholderia sp. 22PA0099]|uniref:fimbrial protein n=1 Tax=Burkholderia sp. 22PA0099 TaxID=3237372 RepID=UPI0039C0B7A9
MIFLVHTIRRLGLGALLMLLLCGAAHAECTYNDKNPYGARPYTLVSPLVISALTVGRDVPVGTILYRQTVTSQTQFFTCVVPSGVITSTWPLTATPLPLASWNQNPFAGHVYQTGVAGIGVAIYWGSNNAAPTSNTLNNCNNGNGACNWSLVTPSFNIVLIKTGPVSPGVISGTSLPTVENAWNGGSVPLKLLHVSFTGSIRIVAQTCTTPDVNVDLGKYTVQALSGNNAATPWKPFAIQLQACPAFYGATGTSTNTDSGSGFMPGGFTTPNQIGFSLAPATPVIDPANAIVALSPGTPSKPSASGIGVQVANGAGKPVSFNTLMPSGITPQPTSGGAYAIPLQARYTRTTGTVAAGQANASMTFTINYQ